MGPSEALNRYTGRNYQSLQAESIFFFQYSF